jgi:putative transposase
LARIDVDLSKTARARLKWFDYYESHGRNARLTCRHFGIAPQTFYRWKRRYDSKNLRTLEDRSSRPKRCRAPEYKSDVVMAVQRLREEYPRWGKDKLVVLVRQEGYETSASTVGRILSKLKARGALVEPVWRAVSKVKRRRLVREYATRKPKGYTIESPGDLVQVDTVDVRPEIGKVFKQFTARDMVSKWDVLGVSSRATATAAAGFVDEIEERMPFGVKAIQVDGGSEFCAEFEQACKKRGIRLFVLPPRSPKLNGCVERANRTHTEEFYDVYPMIYTVAGIRAAQSKWEDIYNTVRPHQALGYLTPLQYLQQHRILGKEDVSLRY